jgi:hypothetical protein
VPEPPSAERAREAGERSPLHELHTFSTCFAVLARMSAKLVAPVEAERPHVEVGWSIEREGHKLHTGSAIFGPRGELKAFARALWIEIRQQ